MTTVNLTKYFILPPTITEQEKDDFDTLLSAAIRNYDTKSSMDKHSEYIQHPTDGRYIYAINGAYKKAITDNGLITNKVAYCPSDNFADATDNTQYDYDHIVNEGFVDISIPSEVQNLLPS